MKQVNASELGIPIITEVIRNIDGTQMVRCSYFSIQSDSPLPNWNISIFDGNTRILLLNLEAILLGPMLEEDEFNSIEEIDSMYDFIEKNHGLFVDINDIWIPLKWFYKRVIENGLVYRLSEEKFELCWRLRNDGMTITEFSEQVPEIEKSDLVLSEKETQVFKDWTKKQIQQSQEIYRSERGNYLQKIDS